MDRYGYKWTTNTGTVTSYISGALSVTGSPITTSGTLAFSWLVRYISMLEGWDIGVLPPSANYLNDLDVTITSPGTGQLLRFNGTEWVNWTPNFLTSNQTITLSGDVTGKRFDSISYYNIDKCCNDV